jgi:RNA-directed DNA polymerase
MSRLQELRHAKTKPDFAKILGIKPSTLTYYLYVIPTKKQYTKFKIPKKNGGKRVIHAPDDSLKKIQSLLSCLLLDCLDEIYCEKFPESELCQPSNKKSKILKIKCSNAKIKQPSLSHGFERNRSIITNAMMHLGRKNVFNLDLKKFFDSFNFGRVRGFFIKNRNFELHPDIATLIAKIACYKNKLPQGSPSSPVITNLIAHLLDIKLAKLASINSCIYTRYADDITFSSREKEMPADIAREKNGKFVVGKKLKDEIRRSGFRINNKKTRNQYRDSRQDVTGLIVNQKPNTKKEYWRTVRAQCYSLFKTGEFKELIDGKYIKGNINRLEGKLNFIDQVDHYNRLREHPPLNPKYQTRKEANKNKSAKLRRYLHNGREVTFSKFLYYRLFYANELPTILTEGKTDNIYLKSAIHMLANLFPKLASIKTTTSPYKLNLRFFEYTKRTRYLLELYGGTDYLKDFVIGYKRHFDYFEAPLPENPVIIIVDNDDGPRNLVNYINKIPESSLHPPASTDIRSSEFVHIFHNLYLILTPQTSTHKKTDIEFFFTDKDRLRKYANKCFNTVSERDPESDLSKSSFAEHIVHANKKNIDFTGFNGILGRIVKVIDHYGSTK